MTHADAAIACIDAAITGGHAARAGDLVVHALTGDPIAPTDDILARIDALTGT